MANKNTLIESVEPEHYSDLLSDSVVNSIISKLNKDDKRDIKIYTTKYFGMGCYFLCKRDSLNGKLFFQFVHSDDMYSKDVIKTHDDFINGYTFVENND